MIHAIEYLATTLKKARERKKLSQRALSRKTGVPQSQISKIENASVDLQASSLIGLARALDLEVMLVPRKHVTAVEGLIRTAYSPGTPVQEVLPAYRLDRENDGG